MIHIPDLFPTDLSSTPPKPIFTEVSGKTSVTMVTNISASLPWRRGMKVLRRAVTTASFSYLARFSGSSKVPEMDKVQHFCETIFNLILRNAVLFERLMELHLKPHARDVRLRPYVADLLGWFARNTPVITLEQVGNVRKSRGVCKIAASSSYPARSPLNPPILYYGFNTSHVNDVLTCKIKKWLLIMTISSPSCKSSIKVLKFSAVDNHILVVEKVNIEGTNFECYVEREKE